MIYDRQLGLNTILIDRCKLPKQAQLRCQDSNGALAHLLDIEDRDTGRGKQLALESHAAGSVYGTFALSIYTRDIAEKVRLMKVAAENHFPAQMHLGLSYYQDHDFAESFGSGHEQFPADKQRRNPDDEVRRGAWFRARLSTIARVGR